MHGVRYSSGDHVHRVMERHPCGRIPIRHDGNGLFSTKDQVRVRKNVVYLQPIIFAVVLDVDCLSVAKAINH
jgi:hypothetical protein